MIPILFPRAPAGLILSNLENHNPNFASPAPSRSNLGNISFGLGKVMKEEQKEESEKKEGFYQPLRA
jgi:hypothetical protein